MLTIELDVIKQVIITNGRFYMNALNENVRFYGSYFHGVHDIIEFKSVKQVALGALKILSGFTGIVPIIFGVGYLIAQNKLKNLESLCGRVSKALTSEVRGEQPTQNELITFLAKMVLDNDNDNNNFEAGFKKLDYISQKELFASMADKRLLVDAVARVPKDVRRIALGVGCNTSKDMIDHTIMQLGTFGQLHTITFDFSQKLYYSEYVNRLIRHTLAIIDFAKNFQSGSSSSYDDEPASLVIAGVCNNLTKKNALAQITFCFEVAEGGYEKREQTFILRNPSRMAKIPEEDNKPNCLNYFVPGTSPKDIWLAC